MKYAPQGVRLRVCSGRSLRKEAEAMPDLNELNETEERRVPAEAGAPASDSVILSEAKDPTPQDDAAQEEGGPSSPAAPRDDSASSAAGAGAPAPDSVILSEAKDPTPQADSLQEEGGPSEALPPRDDSASSAPDLAPDPDEEPLPKYVLPVFLGVIALIAALIVVLFFAPGLVRSRVGEGSDSASIPSSAPVESASAPSSSSSYSYSTIDELPDFILYGVTPYLMKEGEPYSYLTEDIDEEGTSLVGVITARSYIKGELTAAAQAFAAETGIDLTGYESRRVTFEISFEDGYPEMGYLCTDYYNAAEFESEFDMMSASPDGEYEYYAGHIVMNGEERHIYLLLHAVYDYEESFVAAVEWDVVVPEGYDGVCVGYYNTMLEQSEDYQNADTVLDCFDRDNMFFFRCD